MGVTLFAALRIAALHGQDRGQADVAMQGFYMSGSSQSLSSTTGIAVRFQDFIPDLGILTGSFEGYGADNQLRTGEDFLQLRGAPWMGYHWTITGGDFRAPGSLIDYPFDNIFTPPITARGVRIQATHQDTEYSFFAGEETLSAGPRVPYRILAPQNAIGASVIRGIGPNLRIGARIMELSSSPQDIANNPALFPAGLAIGRVRTVSVQALYTPVKRLKLYGELSRSMESSVLSSVAGVSWEEKVLAVRANYVVEGAQYFPLVGYFTGDRRGPFIEMRLRPCKALELYGSASQFRNNLANDANTIDLRSGSFSAGFNVSLPWKLSANGQISDVDLSSQAPGSAALPSDNRQLIASLSRTLGRHSLQIDWRDLNLVTPPVAQSQRSTEIQDMYQLGHFAFGGAARLEQTGGSTPLNSVYLRGSMQGTAGRFSAFANVDFGNDLVNRTVFATNTYDTTVVGVGVKLWRAWNLHAEAFRNRMVMVLNPESVFVLEGTGAAVSQILPSFNQWSLFFSLTKQLRWRGGLPAEGMDQFAAGAVPLVGTVEGAVRIRALSGAVLAAGIPITLDGGHTATSGSDGRYLFSGVPEGQHEVSLSVTELPADFDPGDPAKTRVMVQPRHVAHADFEVLPLSSIEGAVTGPEGATLDGILIRLLPGMRYTLTASEGRFAFYNVREGDFNLAIDAGTLPPNGKLLSEPSFPVAVRAGSSVPSAIFATGIVSSQKAIRKVFDKR
jgi:hypothetical protein